MFILYTFALLSTLLLVNTMYAELLNTILNKYSSQYDTDNTDRARLKITLIVIASIFWGAILS